MEGPGRGGGGGEAGDKTEVAGIAHRAESVSDTPNHPYQGEPDVIELPENSLKQTT